MNGLIFNTILRSYIALFRLIKHNDKLIKKISFIQQCFEIFSFLVVKHFTSMYTIFKQLDLYPLHITLSSLPFKLCTHNHYRPTTTTTLSQPLQPILLHTSFHTALVLQPPAQLPRGSQPNQSQLHNYSQ